MGKILNSSSIYKEIYLRRNKGLFTKVITCWKGKKDISIVFDLIYLFCWLYPDQWWFKENEKTISTFFANLIIKSCNYQDHFKKFCLNNFYLDKVTVFTYETYGSDAKAFIWLQILFFLTCCNFALRLIRYVLT